MRSDRAAASWAARRGELVPMRAPNGRSSSRTAVRGDQAVAGIAPLEHRADDEARHGLGREVLERVHDEVDSTVEQRPFELLRELPVDLHPAGVRSPSADRVAPGRDRDQRRSVRARGLRSRRRSGPGPAPGGSRASRSGSWPSPSSLQPEQAADGFGIGPAAAQLDRWAVEQLADHRARRRLDRRQLTIVELCPRPETIEVPPADRIGLGVEELERARRGAACRARRRTPRPRCPCRRGGDARPGDPGPARPRPGHRARRCSADGRRAARRRPRPRRSASTGRAPTGVRLRACPRSGRGIGVERQSPRPTIRQPPRESAPRRGARWPPRAERRAAGCRAPPTRIRRRRAGHSAPGVLPRRRPISPVPTTRTVDASGTCSLSQAAPVSASERSVPGRACVRTRRPKRSARRKSSLRIGPVVPAASAAS